MIVILCYWQFEGVPLSDEFAVSANLSASSYITPRDLRFVISFEAEYISLVPRISREVL